MMGWCREREKFYYRMLVSSYPTLCFLRFRSITLSPFSLPPRLFPPHCLSFLFLPFPLFQILLLSWPPHSRLNRGACISHPPRSHLISRIATSPGPPTPPGPAQTSPSPINTILTRPQLYGTADQPRSRHEKNQHMRSASCQSVAEPTGTYIGPNQLQADAFL